MRTRSLSQSDAIARTGDCRAVRVDLSVSLMMRPTGPELRAARMTAGIPVTALADALGRSVARVRAIETQRGLRPETAERYVQALRDAWAAREREALAEVRNITETRDPRELVRELVAS